MLITANHDLLLSIKLYADADTEKNGLIFETATKETSDIYNLIYLAIIRKDRKENFLHIRSFIAGLFIIKQPF